MNNSVQCPTKDSDVITICTKCRGVIGNILVIPINGIKILNVVYPNTWTRNFVRTFLTLHSPTHSMSNTTPDFVAG